MMRECNKTDTIDSDDNMTDTMDTDENIRYCDDNGNIDGKENIEEENTNDFELLNIKDVPDYAKEEDITTGYRKPLDYQGCIRSILWLHNETVNIWTHLLGFFFFLWLMVDNLIQSQDHIRDSFDYWATATQLLTYQACMLSSSLFHTFICHSAPVKAAWQEMDHACILIAMYGTYVRIIINNFQCFPVVRTTHLTIVTALFGSVLWLKYKPRSGTSKVSLPMFFTVALYSAAPFGHWVHLSSSVENSNVDSTMISWMFFPFLLGGVGVLFYVSHFPEAVVPCGRVDLCGASHQIWHVLIFSGMAAWYYLSCWVSTTRPLTCKLVDDMTCPVDGSGCSMPGLESPVSSLLNSSFAQFGI